MNTQRSLHIVAFMVLTLTCCVAQERIPGNKIKPAITISLEQSKNSPLFRYAISNGKTAEQAIFMFELHLSPNLSIQTVGSPTDWRGSYINEGGDLMIHWGTGTDNDVKPGKTMSGYTVSAIAIPGIVVYFAEGWVPSPDSIPEDSKADSIYHNLTPYGPGVIGRTIGPVLPQESFAATDFLDTLISYKHQALALKWIDNEGIANSLDQKLENARQRLQSGDSVAARNILNAFVNEVEAQKDKYLSSEAYALLKFNAEYLIDRLPQAGKKEK